MCITMQETAGESIVKSEQWCWRNRCNVLEPKVGEGKLKDGKCSWIGFLFSSQHLQMIIGNQEHSIQQQELSSS
jgi:hypothetical protein